MYPCKPQFYHIKVGIKAVKIIYIRVFVMHFGYSLEAHLTHKISFIEQWENIYFDSLLPAV